jgi:hypothetical protein
MAAGSLRRDRDGRPLDKGAIDAAAAAVLLERFLAEIGSGALPSAVEAAAPADSPKTEPGAHP